MVPGDREDGPDPPPLEDNGGGGGGAMEPPLFADIPLLLPRFMFICSGNRMLS